MSTTTSELRALAIAIGRTIDELVRAGVFDERNVSNIDGGVSNRISGDAQAEDVIATIMGIAYRSLPRDGTT